MQLLADAMNANDVPFVTSISNHIHHGTSNSVDNIKAKVLEVILINIIKKYAIKGYSVGVIFIDIQFKRVKDRKNLGAIASIVSREKHIERYNRVIE